VTESVFIETTIPSYLAARRSRDIVQAARQELTNEWWAAQRHRYKLVTSQVVLDEAARGEPDVAERRLKALQDIDQAVVAVATDLVARGIVPWKAADDALHIACAAPHDVDFLLTWNCRHIANPHSQRPIRECLAAHGANMPVICTPEEMIADEG